MPKFVCYADFFETPGETAHRPIEAGTAADAALIHARSWYDTVNPEEAFEEIRIFVTDEAGTETQFDVFATPSSCRGKPPSFEVVEVGATPDPNEP